MREYHPAIPPGWAAHPEIAIGIPYAVVSVRAAFKAKWAEDCGYRGPLTLDDAVKKHRISVERAEYLVRMWEQAPHKQFPELPTPRVTHPAVQFSDEDMAS